MKKWLIIIASAALLAACSDQAEKEPVEPAEQNTESPAENKVEEPEVDQEEPAENEAIADEEKPAETGEAGQNTAADYPEQAMVAEKSGEQDLTPIVESDNPGNRVILYQDGQGMKKYKSIYIKKENRLKIIDLANDGMIFNEIVNL